MLRELSTVTTADTVGIRIAVRSQPEARNAHSTSASAQCLSREERALTACR